MPDLKPPPRYTHDSFDTYRTDGPTQEAALQAAREFVASVRAQQTFWARLGRRLGMGGAPRKGLYLVGPVGTGKTHLLAAMYHALHPEVPCAFLHSSALFRTHAHPEAFARTLAGRYRVLCLDEVELDDPANEARLVLVLKTLERLGVVILATSNVEPERFLSAAYGSDRFQRFLTEFRRQYEVVFVGGEDYRQRQAKPGTAWIGPHDETVRAMQAAFDGDPRRKRWLRFDELMHAATETEHTRLMAELTRYESLYLEAITVRGTDDALRLLRIMDELYQQPHPPVLFFTSPAVPEAWLAAEGRAGLEKGVADKFTRATSRLRAFCTLEQLRDDSAAA